jgi:tetratricopeptide (TPR) repeat protein
MLVNKTGGATDKQDLYVNICMSTDYQIYPDMKECVSNLNNETETHLEKGVEFLTQGDMLSALYHFEKAFSMDNSALISSYYAFCIAKERGQFSKAISLCKEAIREEPQNPSLYLNLGRIYHLSNRKADAVKTLREGLKFEANQQIVEELTKLGTRKPPVLPFLKRNNPLNKYLGIILKKLRLR